MKKKAKNQQEEERTKEARLFSLPLLRWKRSREVREPHAEAGRIGSPSTDHLVHSAKKAVNMTLSSPAHVVRILIQVC